MKRRALFVLFCFLLSPAVFAENAKPAKPKPKTNSADIWGYRRGPKAPGSPERLAEEAKNRTPEQALKEAAELKKKSDDKKAEVEKAIAEMEGR